MEAIFQKYFYFWKNLFNKIFITIINKRISFIKKGFLKSKLTIHFYYVLLLNKILIKKKIKDAKLNNNKEFDSQFKF